MSRSRAAIVLAAGKGKRMKSDLPKVLHPINGRPIIAILLDSLLQLQLSQVVVVIGYMGEAVQKELTDYPVTFVWQRQQLGTGHAVQMAREVLGDFQGTTLVALGDVPFLTEATIRQLYTVHEDTGAAATCLSAVLEDPTGYGRIVRDGQSNRLRDIIEDRDTSIREQKIREINTGLFCFDNKLLFEVLAQVNNDNEQGEYYLTDTVKILHRKNLVVSVVTVENPDEALGVNSEEQLQLLARKFDRLSGNR
jgi:bifunctional UDP-N-acetylglucosamine pyrophosphorylase/glucosamine-1-phosphate N-acetyltransferase